jgi:acetyltransferase-like isoleucine patch superfamily enzyme
MSNSGRVSAEDPLSLISRAANKFRSLWMVWTYPFASIGDHFYVHHSCELQRSMAGFIRIGNSVSIGRDAWINIPEVPDSNEPIITMGDGCNIGRRCVVSAKNGIHLGRNAMIAPSVLIMDHNHAFEDVTVSIAEQGVTKGGTIRIEDGCWIGFGAAIVCGQGELVIGRNSIVGANSVVTRSVPPYSVVAGNPARVAKSYDSSKSQWVMGSSKTQVPEKVAPEKVMPEKVTPEKVT